MRRRTCMQPLLHVRRCTGSAAPRSRRLSVEHTLHGVHSQARFTLSALSARELLTICSLSMSAHYLLAPCACGVIAVVFFCSKRPMSQSLTLCTHAHPGACRLSPAQPGAVRRSPALSRQLPALGRYTTHTLTRMRVPLQAPPALDNVSVYKTHASPSTSTRGVDTRTG